MKARGACRQRVRPHSWHEDADSAMTNKSGGEREWRLSPQNSHHASSEREKPAVDEDQDPSRASEYHPLSPNRHPRIHPPLILSPPFRESAITALTTGLDSHRIPPLSPQASNFFVFETKVVMDQTIATPRPHARDFHPSFAFRSCVVTRMGYGDWVYSLLTKRIPPRLPDHLPQPDPFA